MPKIRAATVAEHRQLQRAALLGAARNLLAEGGIEALTFPALAARTGLARSSVYEYFRSRAAVVEELCAVDFPLWAAEIEAGMAACDSPQAQVEAYVRGQLALAGDPRHRAVAAVSVLELDEAARARIRAAHVALVDLVVRALLELGHEQPRLAAALLQGVVEAAVRQAEHVADGEAGTIAEAAVAMALHGLGTANPA
ncbi:helix-turn-helix domain-containing protein [Kitasatospora sp. MAP5-34]|uniref:TetR/AcrR family transcriptional regulator n=1 Tax=Kitasatospora sp. MAP5-34 TaxID=3035102 RepID=UPI0024738B82|nr:helix-turn-helix domain-containing protein [Kitasatospora sp. MAP5-34]MDH6578882.1 AcrR family transcriptional regulator [Kitasatospora sp. MAP5-34]